VRIYSGILICLLALSAQADHFDGGAGAGDPSWFTSLNWDTDLVPTNTTTVQAIKPNGLLYGVVVDAPGAEAASVNVGIWGHPGELTVNAAGTLNVAGSMTLAVDAGQTGTVVHAGSLDVAGTLVLNNGGAGIFTMSNGTVNVASLDLVQTNGTGRLNLFGGTIYAPSLQVDGNAENTIEITGGQLITNGDRSGGLNWMAGLGRITAYGGAGEVYAWYDSGANQTTLFALPDAQHASHFTDPQTGAQFHPVGFNYIDLRLLENGVLWHDTFNPSRYDEAVVSSNLADIAAAGFNTVRVFIDNQVGSNSVVLAYEDTELSPAYMQNVASFLEQAHAHGIGVVPCVVYVPTSAARYFAFHDPTDNVEGMNQHHLTAWLIAAKRLYLRDFIQTLTALAPERVADTIIAFDLQNECCYYLNVPPFSLSSGTVTPANGVTYDLATDKVKLADEMAVYWVDQMAEVVHQEAPGSRVDVNVFTYAAVGRSIGDFSLSGASWKDRYPFRPEALAASDADLLDIHFYTSDSSELQHDLNSIEFGATAQAWMMAGKPMIVGEFGAHTSQLSFEEAVDWKQDEVDRFAEYGFQGWIYWTYENDLQTHLWHAVEGNGEIFDALAQGAQTNYPASQFEPSAIQVIDTDVQLQWNTVAGESYQTVHSPDLIDPVWTAAGVPRIGTGSTVTNSVPASEAQGFYKVRKNN
jgi:hypothetical protein